MPNRDSMQKTTHSLFYEMMLCVLFLFAFSLQSYGQCDTPKPTEFNTFVGFCPVDRATIASLRAKGENIEWFSAQTGGAALPSTTLLSTGRYWVQQTIDGCASERAFTVVTISEPPPPTVALEQFLCSVLPPTIYDLVADGTEIAWYDSKTSETQLPPTEILENGKQYWASQKDLLYCESVERASTTVYISTPPPAPTANSDQNFCAIDNPTVADLKPNETNIKWYTSENETISLDSKDALIDGKHYWGTQTNDAGCESETRLEVTVSITTVEPPTTNESIQEFCITDNATVADLSPNEDNIKWYANETDTDPLDSSVALEDNTDYYASQTNSENCESITRLKVTVSILSVEPPTTNESEQKFCITDNALVRDLKPDGTNIKWYISETDTDPLDSLVTLEDDTDYWATQINDAGCESETRLKVTVSITTVEPPETTESTQNFCIIDNPTVGHLKPEGTNIKWYISETDTEPLDSSVALMHNTDYWATQTNDAGCESETKLKVTVFITTVEPPTTDESTQNFCAIDNPTVTDLKPNETNIKWYANEADTESLYPTVELIDGKHYWATQTNGAGCESETRLEVTVSITTVEPPTTDESIQKFCITDNALVGDLKPNEDNIKWYANENDTTSLPTKDALKDNTDYYATQTNTENCESITRLKVTVSILSVEPPTTNESEQKFCITDNALVRDLKPDGTNIKWYANETDTTALYTTDALIDDTDYWATQINDAGCESETRLKVTVSILPIEPTATAESTQVFCVNDNPTVANLVASGTLINWYATKNDTEPLSPSVSLIDEEDYWAAQTNAANCESETKVQVKVSILPVQPATIVNSTQVFCVNDNATVKDLEAEGLDIKWYDNEDDTIPLTDSTVLKHDEEYWATQSNSEKCESATKIKVTVSILQAQTPTATNSIQVFCKNNNPTVRDLKAEGTNIKWYANKTDTNPLSQNDSLINEKYYFATQTNGIDCESETRLRVKVSILSVDPPETTNNAPIFCIYSNPKLNDLEITGERIKWYATEDGTTPLSSSTVLINNTDYWATQTNDNGCESISRLRMTPVLTATLPSIIHQETVSFCEIENATVKELNSDSSTTIWYESEFSTTPLNLTTKLINGEDYWSQEIETINNCEQATKIQKTVHIIKVDPPTTTNPTPVFCVNDNATVADLSATGTNIKWYATENDTTPLPTTDTLINNTDYWATQTNDNCESTTRLKVTITIQQISAPTTPTNSFSFCKADSPTLEDISLNEENIQWYASENSQTPLPITDKLTDGNSYWAANIDPITLCESSKRIEIKTIINDTEKAKTPKSTQIFCATSDPTIENIEVEGKNITWYLSKNSKDPLSKMLLLEHNTTYWATQKDTITGCESSERLDIMVLLQNPIDIEINERGNQFCKTNLPTIFDLTQNISSKNKENIVWYNSFPNGNELDPSELLIHGATYFALDPSDICNLNNPLDVKVDLTYCETSGVKYYDGFSPNGDGINDSYTITNLRDLYPNFNVEFYNRWGKILYISNASNPDWNGKNNGNGELAPEGIYYFIIYFNNGTEKPVQNTLYLSK
ncbi:MAG: gliding motility-associated C-terminal domain-containing protein [Lutibacter sp.]|nr:gliding motility-associated C-terminal domain-containing protein [Lutibacter sp.]